MSGTHLEQLTWIDPLADRFEQAWKEGPPPRLEECLEAVPAEQRGELLRELLPVELHHRRQRNEEPTLAEYERRLPEHLAVVRDAFRGPPTTEDTLPLTHAQEAASHQPGHYGRYPLSRLHREGGLGQVWVAQDEELNREVALKALRPQHAADSGACQRFFREAQVTGQLEHPNIVPVYELNRRPDDGQPFYTMRLVRGRTLREELRAYHARRGAGQADPLGLPRLLTAFVSVCQAVSFAHARGVLHRDLKPDNVMLGSFGEVVLLDWGLARTLKEAEAEAAAGVAVTPEAPPETTAPGCVMGTPAYMAPEQAAGRGDLIDARTDVYGLGAILFEILTGRPPRQGKNVADTLRQVAACPVPRARSVDPAVPPALDAICARALAQERGARYAAAAELAEDVQRFLADEPVSVYREPWTQRLFRWVRRHRTSAVAIAAAVGGVVVASVVAAVVLAGLADRERAARRAAEDAREQGICVTARFAARTVAREVALRWAVLEGAAAEPELRRLVQRLLTAEQIRPQPEWPQLQAWLKEQHTRHLLTTRAASWLITDARGRHLGRHPENGDLVGRSLAHRDYFHGTGKKIAPSARGIAPLRDVHCSLVYESHVTRRRLVAFSVPVWSAEPNPPDRRVLAILSMTVELGYFGALQTSLAEHQLAVLVDLRQDWVEGEGRKGLLLHHPRLVELSRADGQRPEKPPVFRLDPARVERLERLRRLALDRERREAELGWTEQLAVPARPTSENLERGYEDPAGGSYRGPWLAAFEPVLIKRRTSTIEDLGWVVIVQERRAAAEARAGD